MLHRYLALAVLGMLACADAPAARGQDAAQQRAEVIALSQRIDSYLARRAQEAGLTLAARAEDGVFFRRLNLDLAGKIPALTDVDDFISNPDPDKRWATTEQLLAAETYPRHMANLWRSLILGNNSNIQLRFLTPSFEGWLREQLQRNTSLDAMTRLILTASPNPQSLPLNRGMAMQNGPGVFYQINENKPENLATATSRVFLGVKLDCAQCHAHPFASWTRDQFWEFAAFFSALPGGLNQPRPAPTKFVAGREIEIPNLNKVVKAKFLTGQEPNWEGVAANASPRVLADWVTAANNPYFARAMADHVWSYLMGASLLEPILEPGHDERATHPELLDELARQLAAHRFDLKFLLRAIIHSDAYQRSSTGNGSREEYEHFARRLVRGLAPEQVFDSIAEATAYKEPDQPALNQNPFDFNQQRTPRAQFLAKFQSLDLRGEPQTSILQVLFLMNGQFIAERTNPDNNDSLQVLARQQTSTARKVQSLYLMVLSRPPRPEESERMVRYVDRGGATGDAARALSDVYWGLLNSAEFLLNH